MTPIDRERDGPASTRAPLAALDTIRRNWIILVACPILAAVGGYGISTTQPEKYRATSALLFRDADFSQQFLGASYRAPSKDPNREAATNVRLVSLRSVAVSASKSLDGTLSAQAISDMVTVSPQGESNIVTVTAESSDPRQAAQVADAFAEQFVASRQKAASAQLREAVNLIRARLRRSDSADAPGAAALRTLNDQLHVMLTLQTGNAEVVQTASVPSAPSSPRPMRSAMLGLVLGIVLAAAIVAVRSQFDTRIRDSAELEDLTGWPILATIGRSPALAQGAKSQFGSGAPMAERFGLLRARLRYFNVDKEIRSLLIASSHPGEGKSTVALHLAAAYAQVGARVVIVEADLRRPTLAASAQVPRMPGVAELVSERLSLSSVIQRVVIDEGQEMALDLIVAGGAPPNPTAVLESDVMRNALERLTTDYDMVIIDTAPTASVSDAMPLFAAVDGAIVVSNLSVVRRNTARQLSIEFTRLRAPVLGAVVNGVDEPAPVYYGYEAPVAVASNSGSDS